MFLNFLLASLVVGTATPIDVSGRADMMVFHKRQAFQPGTQSCSPVPPGSTCADSCGAGYILCSDPTTFLCYNPGAGQSCCSPGSPASCQWFLEAAKCIVLCSPLFQGRVSQIASASLMGTAVPTAKTLPRALCPTVLPCQRPSLPALPHQPG